MPLAQYRKKRAFSHTPEPEGGDPAGNGLRFVVQKHDASRLHYDFRLELGGVLKSWAVPKGPSLNPADKRLAMLVEDHPYDYRRFEGTIPAGNYGAGTVIVWDEGEYEPLVKAASKKAAEKELRKELRAGSLKIVLHGSKLKGEFALVRIKGKDDNAWLLIKHRDRYASEKSVTDQAKSVISRKSIEQMAKPGAGKKKAFPKSVHPMLATLVDTPFDRAGWVYEVKWDGYRAIAFIRHGKAELFSRNQKSFSEKYYPVRDALRSLAGDLVLDGEIVSVNADGYANFGRLQNWRSEADGELIYYVFDLLWMNGRDLTGLPLSERRALLDPLIDGEGVVRLSEQFATNGLEFYEQARKLGLEGIVAKKADSLYEPGARSKNWLKIKAQNRQEVVIGGYTVNEDSPRRFSSLLVGVFENKKLRYTGKIGTGFDEAVQKSLMAAFKKLARKESPFDVEPDVNKPSRFRPVPPKSKAHWLQPKLVCEVSFLEMTADGVMRHPSFEGLREDKNAKDVHPDRAQAAPAAKSGKNAMATRMIRPANGEAPATLLNPGEKKQVKTVNGHDLIFTNLDKIYWPKEKYTKRDLLNYYYRIAPVMLPYMKDRPQSLNRFPNGIAGANFYQKDVTGKVPGWLKLFPYHSEGDDQDKNFLVCTDEASLLYIASLGCIEMNPWNSRVKKPDNPDFCIIDLDPDPKKNTFAQVIEAARVTHDLLESVGVTSFPKTSGSTGIHIYIPLGAKYSYEQSKEFARAIVTKVHAEIPGYTTLERTVAKRKGGMYLDFLQNRPQATIAAAYSVRPKPGATVSAPLRWEEVKKTLKMSDFTIANMAERVRSEGDPFEGVLGKGISIPAAIKRMG